MKIMYGLWIMKMMPIFRILFFNLLFQNKKLALWMVPYKIYVEASLSLKDY